MFTEYGPKIRALRIARKMTAAKVAEEIGISATYLSLIERDRVPPPCNRILIDLALLFDMPTDDFYVAANRMPPDIPVADAIKAYRDRFGYPEQGGNKDLDEMLETAAKNQGFDNLDALASEPNR